MSINSTSLNVLCRSSICIRSKHTSNLLCKEPKLLSHMAFSNSKSSLLSLYPSFSGTKVVILFLFLVTESSSAENSNLFREYIGANFKDVKFSDVPINPKTQFDFILSFAIDYTTTSDPTPTNGKFNIFWDSINLSPQDVNSIKSQHSNVRVALSLGGATVSSKPVYFNLTTVNSWVSNAFISLKSIIQEYHLDGIDIDYEQFQADPNTFAECIGQLIMKLKANGLIKFVSIAPYDNSEVQNHYQELWKIYGDVIDYVNFQFYAYDKDTSVDQFVKYYEEQKRNYQGGKILISFITDGNGGLGPQDGFFDAAKKLKSIDELNGIFVWCADNSKALGFKYEKQSQVLLASST